MSKMDIDDALSVRVSKKEDRDCSLYKISHYDLSSYCRSTEFLLSKLTEAVKLKDLEKSSLILYSMKIGLKFILEDISETDRKINTE